MKPELRERFQKGIRLFDLGRAEKAVAELEACRRQDRDDPQITLNLGHALAAAGDPKRAAALYRELMQSPDEQALFAAYWSLADLKGARFTSGETKRMAELAGTSRGRPGRFLLMFALGQALDRQQDHAGAFNAWREANDEVAVKRPYSQAAWSNLAHTLRSIRDVPRAASVAQGPKPVFIVGMPRSGSTLVEQLLGAHSAVQATSELPFIENIARSLDRQGGFAARLPLLSGEACARAAESYLAQARPFLDASTPYFTDKWPNNFWYIGLIRALFPDAPVINVIRDPLDNAIGVYRQYFSHGNEHSFRLEWTADYWEVYLDVMQFWESLFSGQVLHLAYRDIVTEPEMAARRIFNHCGLAFEAATLEFHRRERTVMTPSAQQVRQPIYTSALDSSRPYRPFLQDLLPRFESITKKAGTLPGF